MRLLCFALVLAATWPLAAPAQSLKDAFDAAWRRSPAGAAELARGDEAAARSASAGAWLRESPSLTASYRTDQIDLNQGRREYEVELGVLLSTPGERNASRTVGEAEALALQAQQAAARLALAKDVREAFWAARLAQVEHELAQRRLDEAGRLADDLARRLAAGEAARVDANQARGAQLAAEAALRAAQVEAQRSLKAFTTLTGLPRLPQIAEARAPAPGAGHEHPLLVQAQANAQAARARADQAAQVRRDTPEYTVTLTRERDDFTALYGNSVRFGVRVPLGSDVRNAVRIAQAGADRTEAEAALQLEIERLKAEQALAREDLAVADAAQTGAQERVRLARDTQQLIARAHQLGERDLATRLRADTERFEAELSAARAEAELGRAISRINQSLGLLP
jgi:cobalt-zinc-cadmium efflux system outer membrane protein